MVEILGIIASLFILVCFTFNDEKFIRIFDGIGAFLYLVYGILIGSFSNIFLNTILIGIQIYKIVKLEKKRNVKQSELNSTST